MGKCPAPPRPHARRHSTILSLLLFLFAFLLYAFCLYPEAGPIDSGELITAAWMPGIAHAPGFPAYIFCGWLWTFLFPIGSIAWKLNLFSACSAALAVVLAYCLSRRLCLHYNPSDPILADLAAFCGALSLTTGLVYWRWALSAEVYAFHGLLLAASLWFAGAAKESRHNTIYSGCLMGAGLAVHWVSALMLLPMIFGFQCPTRGSAPSLSKGAPKKICKDLPSGFNLLLFGGCAFGTALIWYTAMLLLARSEPLLNWGNPATWERLWWHFTARQYQSNLLSGTTAELLSALWSNLLLWGQEFTFIGWILAFWGWRQIGLTSKLWVGGWILGAIMNLILGTLQSAAYTHPTQDRDAYLLPLLFGTSLGIASGLDHLALSLERRYRLSRKIVMGVFLTGLLVLTWTRLPIQNRSGDTSSTDYAENALQSPAPQALLLAADWQLVSPSLYLTEVRGLRKDIALIDIPLWQNRPWYVDQFSKRYPQLALEWSTTLGPFLQELRLFEMGKLLDSRRIAHYYSGLLAAMLSTQSKPVYLDWLALEHIRQFGAGRTGSFLPEGLLFRYYADHPPADLPELSWTLHSFLDPNHSSDPIIRHMRLQHVRMLDQRIRFFQQQGKTLQADQTKHLAESLLAVQ